jgi:hypothetical protein
MLAPEKKGLAPELFLVLSTPASDHSTYANGPYPPVTTIQLHRYNIVLQYSI